MRVPGAGVANGAGRPRRLRGPRRPRLRVARRCESGAGAARARARRGVGVSERRAAGRGDAGPGAPLVRRRRPRPARTSRAPLSSSARRSSTRRRRRSTTRKDAPVGLAAGPHDRLVHSHYVLFVDTHAAAPPAPTSPPPPKQRRRSRSTTAVDEEDARNVPWTFSGFIPRRELAATRQRNPRRGVPRRAARHAPSAAARRKPAQTRSRAVLGGEGGEDRPFCAACSARATPSPRRVKPREASAGARSRRASTDSRTSVRFRRRRR